MKALTISDPSVIVLGLQDEIRRSGEARYDHRLHGVLLVAQGMNCCRVAALLGDAPRTVEYWVRRFEEKGLAGLQGGPRPGRPGRLNPQQVAEIQGALQLFGQATQVNIYGTVTDPSGGAVPRATVTVTSVEPDAQSRPPRNLQITRGTRQATPEFHRSL